MSGPNSPESGEVVVHTFYRIVRSRVPTIQDFLSNHAKGRLPKRPTPDVLRLWDGISVYDTLRQARMTARLFPRLGRYIAILRIPEDGSIRFERTQDPALGHFTLWGDANRISACVDGMAGLDAVD